MHKKKRRIELRLGVIAACAACALCGCGQKGALYLPDHAPTPVSSPPAVPAESPPAPSDEATAAPDAPDAPTTRKAPRVTDPATAR